MKRGTQRCKSGVAPLSDAQLAERAAFTRGYACALSDWIRLFNEPSTAAQVLHHSGLTIEILKKSGVEAYDLDLLRAAVGRRTRSRR